MNGKIITDVIIARKLIKMGNQVIDIKPRHGNPVATVFVFRNDEKLLKDLESVISSKR